MWRLYFSSQRKSCESVREHTTVLCARVSESWVWLRRIAWKYNSRGGALDVAIAHPVKSNSGIPVYRVQKLHLSVCYVFAASVLGLKRDFIPDVV